MDRPRLFLIDSFGFIFRAYHARARGSAPPMRTSSGLSTEAVYIFHNMLRKLRTAYQPRYMAAVFESAGETFREQAYAAYKANRAEMPADLAEQIPWIRKLLEAMRVPVFEYPGFEADDVIGAIARQAAGAGADVVIVSSDKDMLQLVGEHVSMFNPVKEEEWYDPRKVEEFLGVPPERVADLLALKGDAIDNIPGAPGIGDKGARELIARFGPVEAVLDHAAEVERRAYRESLLKHREQILLSKKLATIDTTAPIEWSLEAAELREPDSAALQRIYRELEFFSLLRELGPAEEERPRDYASFAAREELEAWLGEIPAGAPVAVAVPAHREREMAFAVQFGLAWRKGEARAVPTGLLDALKPFLEDPGRPKIVHDLKSALLDQWRMGVEPRGFGDDVMLYAFLLSADPAGCTAEALCERLLGRKLPAAPEARAECVLELAGQLRPRALERFRKVYETIDLPLAPVLARMERNGIRIAPERLRELSGRMEGEIQRLTAEIHALAGKPFNINSPQQLGKVLFEDLGLPAPVRHGKGKAVSTAADVLEALAPEHPIVAKVLEYRQLAKLKGTYVDALPALIDARTGRLHTTFNPAGAATGRLSSSNPNLQNIPIRTELGREIRAAFVPEEGWTMVAADYSQIELRLLAHLSRDPLLIEAFRNGEDIHTRTAAEVFGVPPLLVTPELRRNAKAVNFGIVYGQTPFGLAAQLGIPRKDAENYIKSYFERYAGVKRYLEATIAEVRASGAARTLSGRERPIPEINSRNPGARGFAERTAVNTPLQGSAADLIKLAMIRLDALLRERGMRSRMLLQVHDELVLEAPPEEAAALARLAKETMESVERLEVPLVADVGSGPNWRDAK